jgi:N-acetylmuramoyl-L-alanine amidase-like protein
MGRDRGRRLKAGSAVAAVAAVLGIAWMASPALSERSLVSDPVEFEAAAPAPDALSPRAGGRAVLRAAGVRRPVRGIVRPGKRFNVVGLRWRGGRVGALKLRVRRQGGAWSRWVDVPVDSDDAPDLETREYRRARHASVPVWAGEADEVQVSTWAGHEARDLRLHFVNTTGTATSLDRLRKRIRGVVAGAAGALGSLVGARAGAQGTPPAIVSRAAWGADSCPPRANPEYGEVKMAFIHHTVSANDYGPEDSAAMVLGICRYHRNANGWNDIGYNFLVDRYGTVFEGRAGGIGEAVIGAQAQGYNSQSTGIASIGTFSSAGQTDAGLRAIAHLLGWKLTVHGVPPRGQVSLVSAGGATNRFPSGARATLERISGHRDANATACPGNGLYAQLEQIRAMVNPGPPRAATQTAVKAARRNVPYGQKAVLQLGVQSAGTPIAGRRVDVQMLGRLGWRTQHSVSTDAAGSAQTRVRVSSNRQLRGRYGGDAGLLPSNSTPVSIGVRPRVTVALGAGPVAPGDPIAVTGTVAPRKPKAILTVKRQTSTGGLALVSRRSVVLRSARLRTRLKLRRPALYRVRLSVRRDARNLSARSAAVSVRVR